MEFFVCETRQIDILDSIDDIEHNLLYYRAPDAAHIVLFTGEEMRGFQTRVHSQAVVVYSNGLAEFMVATMAPGYVPT